jgi:hypothetical protein
MNLDELKKAAQAATLGPWEASGYSVYSPAQAKMVAAASEVRGKSNFVEYERPDLSSPNLDEIWANVRYIALANPDAILALITRLEAAEVDLAAHHGSKWTTATCRLVTLVDDAVKAQ